jgi:hypothetical protein
MKDEAKKIHEQLTSVIAAKKPETLALTALCTTIRLGGNAPGFEQRNVQAPR